MSLDDGMEQILTALEKKNEDRAFQLYVTQYPHMDKDNFKSFEEWYKPRRINEIENNQSVDEILNDVKTILNRFERR